ncbi:putative bifunctional diguanylate cyclase/phosphodiesterase [Amphritea sp.]|uniref:putative bifunctional diguanylate cyclase/phosphodiesterase n=1 Tax=Amphritea sp. TaxID=1872502 RepID=UPI003A8CAE11
MAHSLSRRIGLIITFLSLVLTISLLLLGGYLLNVVHHVSIVELWLHSDNPLNLLGLWLAGFLLLLMPTLILAKQLSKKLLQPLHQLTEKTRTYNRQGPPVDFELHSDTEFSELSTALQVMQEHLSDSDIQLQRMTYRDTLTGLNNRFGLHQELSKLIRWARKQESRMALLYIDLDHFKQINASSSHAYGDQVLQIIAQRLLDVIKVQTQKQQLPFPEELLISRPGGDQFAVMLPDILHVDETEQLSGRIIEALQQPYHVNDKTFNLSCSIGITLYPDDANSAERMLKHADIAMYEAKHAGRNRARYFLPAMHREVEERVMIQQGISTAIATNQLFLEYQPIVDLQLHKLIGAETLIRWNHPQRGRLGPETFIPIIEESDQIGALTVWLIETAAAELAALPRQQSAKLSINISSAILNKPELARLVNEALLRVSHSPHQLCLEITETSLMKDIDNTLPLLMQWKAAGYRIWIDDFGTGYSSLSYLARLPIDGVKIDRSFIRDLDHSKPVIEAILALAETMDLLTVCEGIETIEQQYAMTSLGCDFAQGFLFSEPLLIDQLKEQLA